MIEFLNIRKAFGSQVVLDDVSLTVHPGQIVYIIGKSGAGKSVLVKHVLGLIRPDSGIIRFEGQDITRFRERDFYPLRKRCAMVFQHSTLFDSMTLLENVALPIRKHKGLSHADSLAAAREKLALVQMEALADRAPADIGDGLRKRVAIARALTLDPMYIVFDEPTTGLDPVSAVRVDRLIRRLAVDTGVTSIVVSHDLRSIFSVADRVVFLYQGKVHLDGPPALFRAERATVGASDGERLGAAQSEPRLIRASTDPVVRQFINGLPEGPMEL